MTAMLSVESFVLGRTDEEIAAMLELIAEGRDCGVAPDAVYVEAARRLRWLSERVGGE
jgi:hypothetical protein